MFLDTLTETLHRALPRYPVAQEYLKGRGVLGDEIRDFKLGYTQVISIPNDGSEDYETFMKETRRGRAFENKIVFPIFDVIGRVIGLFGRSVESKEFKFYLTKEAKFTGIFYGLYQALPSIIETGRVFIVEGPFDLLAFRKVFKNSVCAMTAGVSDAQYDIMSFFANSLVTVFDSDKAGLAAAEEAKQNWGNVTSIDLGYKDPDHALKELSLSRFIKFVQNKVDRKILF